MSALVASLPILYLFWALALKRSSGHTAGLGVIMAGGFVAVFAYGMPVTQAFLSGVLGAAFGLFPISWIVLNALFVYHLAQETGHMETIRQSIFALTPDRALQTLLIAFSFGAFLEGAAGFGVPVAITAAMLVTLGFDPQTAAVLCLVANTAPVAFGALGVPIVVTSGVAGLEPGSVGRVVGSTLPAISVIVPFYLVFLLSGLKGVLRAAPWLGFGGVSFALTQYLSARFLGPHLPDILSALVSAGLIAIMLRLQNSTKEKTILSGSRPTLRDGMRAFFPFILLSFIVALWGIPPIKAGLDELFCLKLPVPWLDGAVLRDSKPIRAVFELNLLSSAGTGLLLTAILSCPVLGVSFKKATVIYTKTLKGLLFPILTMVSFLAFAYIANFSGISFTLGVFLAQIGKFFTFLSAFLGWLGVFLTGSDTSAGALFGMLQRSSAEHIGIDPTILVAANASGGVAGKMVSPSSLAIACAAVGLSGKEGELFLKTIGHSLVFVALISCIVALEAYGVWPL